MVIAALATVGRTPLLIDAVILWIYYKAIRATIYFRKNQGEDSGTECQ